MSGDSKRGIVESIARVVVGVGGIALVVRYATDGIGYPFWDTFGFVAVALATLLVLRVTEGGQAGAHTLLGGTFVLMVITGIVAPVPGHAESVRFCAVAPAAIALVGVRPAVPWCLAAIAAPIVIHVTVDAPPMTARLDPLASAALFVVMFLIARVFARSRLQEDALIDRAILSLSKETAELETARQATQAATAAKDRFVSHISHELRTPLNGILGMVDLLHLQPNASTLAPHLATIESASNEVLGRLNQVLDYARASSGEMVLEARSFDVVAVIERAVARLPNVTLTMENAARSASRVGDEARIVQSVTSLASFFTERFGSAAILLTTTPSGLVVRGTSDKMAPMTDAELNQLLAPFDSGHTGPGLDRSGLSLAYAARLVSLMGGSFLTHASDPARTETDVAFLLKLESP